MEKEHIALIVRELCLFLPCSLLGLPLVLINSNWAQPAGTFSASLYMTTVILRGLAHVTAFLLDSWDMTDNQFMRRYAAYLYRFHWVFRPLYRILDMPVPYDELGSAFRSQRAQSSRQSNSGHHHDARSHQGTYERQETEEERYQRRKREREAKSNNQHYDDAAGSGAGYGSHSSYESSSADDGTYERDGKIYSRDGTELTWMFTVLGVSYRCTYEEAERAYKNLVKQYHPDMVARSGPKIREAAEREMKEINRAWDAVKKLFAESKQR